jgi:uncharacterized membrane-anchored protein
MKKILVLVLFTLSAMLASNTVLADKQPKKDPKAEASPKLQLEGLPPEQAAEIVKQMEEMKKLEASLKYESGVITLKDGLAKISLSDKFRYLNADNAEKVIVDLWGNPPREKSLGMIVPADFQPSGDNSWGVVVTYDEDGYVKDDEAASINYNDLLKQMQEDTRESNQERVKAGYESVEVVGWAQQPHYDAANHKLYWAKELKFGNGGEHTLNYDIRVLGRKGVLSLNAVGVMSQLKDIERDMQSVIGLVEFNQGSRYSDYIPGTDKIATYGIAALIGGKLAAKAGLFKLLIGALIAGKKFVLIGLIAVGALLKKLLTGRSKKDEGEESVSITGSGPAS